VIAPELEQFRQEVDRRAAVIDAPPALLPTYGRTEDGARPHIEFARGQYHYVVVERGNELERHSSADVDPILYHVFQGVTFSMACQRAGRERRPGVDWRRQLFAIQLDLLGRLSLKWQARCSAAIDEPLRHHPFDDAGPQ